MAVELSLQFVKDGAPSHTGGSGSANHGTLDAWRTAFPQAQVEFIGFSLGSGVLGDGVISALNCNGTRYTFAEVVVLAGKEHCKDGGWATSTVPVFRQPGRLRQPLRVRSLTGRSVRDRNPVLAAAGATKPGFPSSVGV